MSMAVDKMLLGLIGAGIGQSLTPAMQEEEARHHGIRLHYQLIDLDRTPGAQDQLPALLAAARIMGFAGLALLAFVLGIAALFQSNSKKILAVLGILFSGLIMLGTLGLLVLGLAMEA